MLGPPYESLSAGHLIWGLGEGDISANMDKLEAADPVAAAHVRKGLERAIDQILAAEHHRPVEMEHGIRVVELGRWPGKQASIKVGKTAPSAKGVTGAPVPGTSLLKVVADKTMHEVTFAPARGKTAPYFTVVVESSGKRSYGKQIPLEGRRKKATRPEGRR
jgi:hypothetical protein